MEWLSNLDWFSLIAWASAIVLIVLGFAGTVVPAIPGLPMIAAGGILIAWTDQFEKIGFLSITFLIVLALIGILVDTFAQSMGAKKAGASKEAIVASFIGAFLGMFFGLVGIFVFPLLFAFAGELYAKRDFKMASKVGWATWMGMIFGTAVKLALAFMMTAYIGFIYFLQ